ncbi:2,3-bisphosphoglycerate-independent phosphoglycerate mutase, partial [Candidatus Uhrbacteria bacterium]|nr:2,3-bisphosphoglycerate-independent phosphoglycerate mutase [Candidatus Uhrbacteria bacterium]MBD3284074.1 2,3-bisphosphoglycerate-independent phosphoglycerate mutase [Candidatus Uhrbacteria bacterium]
CVGLPEGQVGNSEAGHQTIGAGRAVESDLVRINKEIKKNTFHDNPALLRTVAHVTRNKSTLHMMGLLTDTSSGHSYPEHLYALVRFAQELHLEHVVFHLFTDGRDTPPYHSVKLLDEFTKRLPKHYVIGSISGRYYAMDRNRFWERTGKAYHALTGVEGKHATSPFDAVEQAYARGESDEYIQPTVICEDQTCIPCINDNDAIIFWNLRSDRARQLVKPFAMDSFEREEKGAFKRKKKLKNIFLVTLTEFGADIDHVVAAYPNQEIEGTLVEALRSHEQHYIAESEKYVQVTYFFDGGYDRARFNEKRFKIPTYHVARYDEKPQMRAKAIADRIVKSLERDADFICANFANADMVAHTGNLDATIVACEALDDALGIVYEAVQKHGARLLITADHGNAEVVHTSMGNPDTEHNNNPVPLLLAGTAVKNARLHNGGSLADVAPTVLDLLCVEQPEVMTGRSLIRR